MKFGQRDIPYIPYNITTVTKIDKEDIDSKGTLVLPENIDEVEKNATPYGIKVQTIVIPNSSVGILNVRLKRMNSRFILSKGEELCSLFSNIVSPEVILPKTLQSIKNPGFKKSIIYKMEIPDSVTHCDENVFNHSKIKRLTINEKLLSQISAKFLLFIKGNISLTVRINKKQTRNYILSKIDMNTISLMDYIDEAIEMFLNNIHKEDLTEESINKFRRRLKRNLLIMMKIKLLVKNDSEVLINDLVVHDIYLRKILKNNNLKSMPNIFCDGLSIKVNNKKIKTLTLKDFIEQK